MNGITPQFRVEIDFKKIGAWIRQAREELKLSTRELAKLSGISPSHLSRMQSGQDFTVSKLVQLTVTLGMPPALLIEGALRVDPGTRGAEYQDALLADSELSTLVESLPDKGLPATIFAVLDLVDLIVVSTCQLLLSSNPQEALQTLAVPLPALRRSLEKFVISYGLEVDTRLRADVFRAIAQQPVQKLRALGLLTSDVIKEYLERDRETGSYAHSQLTLNPTAGTENEVPQNPDIWLRLVERVSKITSQRGDRARLARDLNVTRQAVSNWLSGASAPSAVITLRLLEWVTAEEAKQK